LPDGGNLLFLNFTRNGCPKSYNRAGSADKIPVAIKRFCCGFHSESYDKVQIYSQPMTKGVDQEGR